ncbi:glycosyltransferase [Ancylothrix sp. C2]|uniref:glycosyltransferase family 39 protein n=1 Tax=Ancylothrix sp. D3o TaxID=2953691 RepID=UPI0021BA7991|nr:glycosyltransferase [Ancylothrix sp. D3o]MCT7950828.1 glycosyltransferase [Ancylothrix sp. D3o]
MNQKTSPIPNYQFPFSDLLLLFFWVIIGAGLRFSHLAGKPPWTDEFATLIAMLGRSFKTTPLNQAISIETLLTPLKLLPEAPLNNVVNYITGEDVHPPLYFVLAHIWAYLFPPSSEYISIWIARSFPAILGVLSIPAMYFFGRLAFRSNLVGQLAAAFMAVSPYGIFLSQEARHYSISNLWVIASLCCLIKAIQSILKNNKIPAWLSLTWVLINTLGMATHFFFALTLIAETSVLFLLLLAPRLPFFKTNKVCQKLPQLPFANLSSFYAVIIGTIAGSLVWVPLWIRISTDEQTQWIRGDGSFNILSLINPIVQALAAWITMLSLLPVESPNLFILIISGLIMLIFFIWALPILWRGIKKQLCNINQLYTYILITFILSAMAEFFLISYVLGIDITRGARYNFVYFPAVILLIAASLATCWKNEISSLSHPQQSVVIIWIMAFLSAITVVSNLGYQKYYRPDLFVPIIEQNTTPNATVLIATNHQTLVQVGEMMGLAWEFKKHSPNTKPQFLLAHEKTIPCQENTCKSPKTLQQTLAKLPRPLDLWLVNFEVPVNLKAQNCTQKIGKWPYINGYGYQLYHCKR